MFKPHRFVHVYDGLFTDAELLMWNEHIRHHAALSFKKFDSGFIEDNDNVQWMSGYDVSSFG